MNHILSTELLKPFSSDKIEFEFESEVDTRHLLDGYTEETGINLKFGGFYENDYPLAVAMNANAFVNVKVRERRLLRKCTNSYKYDPNEYQNSHPLIQQ